MNKISFILLLSILGLQSCYNPCTRTSIDLFELSDELNKNYACKKVHKACNANVILSEYEVINLSSDPIYTGSDQFANISIIEQDQLLIAAEQLAEQFKPNCNSGDQKLVTDIQFIFDILLCTGCTQPYTIYINVTYACCSGRLPH